MLSQYITEPRWAPLNTAATAETWSNIAVSDMLAMTPGDFVQIFPRKQRPLALAFFSTVRRTTEEISPQASKVNFLQMANYTLPDS